MPETFQSNIREAFIKAETAHAAKDYATAMQLYTQILKFEPRYVPALVAQGFLFTHMGKHTDALANAAKAVNIDPTYLQTYHLAVMAMNNSGKKSKSDIWVEKGLAQHPSDPGLLLQKAKILGMKKQVAEAKECCRKALQSKPDFEAARKVMAELDTLAAA